MKTKMGVSQGPPNKETKFKIFVSKKVDDTSVEVYEVEDATSVEDLLDLIEAKQGIDKDTIRLVFNGEELPKTAHDGGDVTMAGLKIDKEDTIFLVECLPIIGKEIYDDTAHPSSLPTDEKPSQLTG